MEPQSIDIRAIIEAVKPLISLVGALLTSGIVVSLATQISKLDIIPWNTTKYPRLTAAVYSFIAALVAVYTSDSVDLFIDSWYGIVGFAVAVLLLSANAYKAIIKGSVLEVKPAETEKKSVL